MTSLKAVGPPVLASLALVATLGVVHGLCVDRWGPSGQLQEATTALDRFPPAFGEWTGADLDYDPESLARAGIRRCVFRRYQVPQTREAVSVLLVCGRGGPISVHTPDVCYAGVGYRQVTDVTGSDVTDGAGVRHTFRTARFAKPGSVSKGQLEIFWAWSRDGSIWEGPENPRLSLARSPGLYKLYVVRETLAPSRAEADGPCQQFLRQALPALRERFSSTAGS